MRSLESNNHTYDLKPKKTYQSLLWIGMVRIEMVLQSCGVLYHMTCKYFDRFLLQGVDRDQHLACFFYLALGLIFQGYWQVNSQRSIFLIAWRMLIILKDDANKYTCIWPSAWHNKYKPYKSLTPPPVISHLFINQSKRKGSNEGWKDSPWCSR